MRLSTLLLRSESMVLKRCNGTRITALLWLMLAVSGTSFSVQAANLPELLLRPHAVMEEIQWSDARWTEGFWAKKFDLCRREVIPAVYRGLLDPKNSEHLVDFRMAAGLQTGTINSVEWSDGDCYKWIESMAFMYAVTKDRSLDSMMDAWIDVIAKAQRTDGYISTNMQLRNRQHYMQYPAPVQVFYYYGGAYHEMYNMGHLLTAACTHYRATGKRNFLDIAIKVADHLEKTMKIGAPELRVMQGNLPNIMGLVDMYRLTDTLRYLQAAQIGIDVRGTMPKATDLCQDHVKFRDETEAVGHSVFATYLYCGAADLYAETGEQAILTALKRIWQSAALHRTYLTGGACAIPNGLSARGDSVHEAFGADYQLPNRTAYNETCANIGNAMWNWRMLLLTGDATYTDIMETVLYNSMLSGLSADGRKFFYANPLLWNDSLQGATNNFTPERWAIFNCFCCPPSIARTIAGLGRWAYSVSANAVWVHLYGGNTLQTRLPDSTTVELKQETGYPWDGAVKFTIQKPPAGTMSLKLRIPGWVESASLKINGENFTGALTPGTYVSVNRTWSSGDVVDLNFPMPVTLVEANPLVMDCRKKLVVKRGPVVYCTEFPKSANGAALWNNGVYIPENVTFATRLDTNLFGGVVVLTGKGLTTKGCGQFIAENADTTRLPPYPAWSGQLYRIYAPRNLRDPKSDTMALTLIPYFSWGNRGAAFMKVWIPFPYDENASPVEKQLVYSERRPVLRVHTNGVTVIIANPAQSSLRVYGMSGRLVADYTSSIRRLAAGTKQIGWSELGGTGNGCFIIELNNGVRHETKLCYRIPHICSYSGY